MYICLCIINSAIMKIKIMARIAITTIVAIISSTISFTAINIDISKASYIVVIVIVIILILMVRVIITS